MHCEVGEWSEWSPCSRSGRTCGFKRGQETRTRQVLQYPSPFGNPCPEISEIKECLVKRRKCSGKKKKNCCKYSACKCSSCVSDPDCWIPVIQHLNFNNQTKTEFFKWSHLRHCLLYLLLTIAFTANNEFVTHGTTSTLYEFQTLLLQLVQSELVVLPLRTTTVYSEDCHCG